MRILFFSHYFPPEVNAPASRTFEHCREWVQAGHEVHVITCVPNHPIGMPFEGYKAGWYRRETRDGILVHRVWTYLSANRGVVRRVINFVSFVPTAVWRALRLGRFDVVVGTSPQFFCAMAAWVFGKATRTPWVFELRDIWPESIPAVGAMRKSAVLGALERLELRMYRDATAVACLTNSFVENLTSRGIPHDKLHFIPNGVIPSAWKCGERAGVRAQLGASDRDVIASYIGTIGMAHGLSTVLDSALQLQRSAPHVRIWIVGDGAELPGIRRRIEANGLWNVQTLGLVARARIPALLAASDISLVTLKPSPIFKTVLPSKMFESMAAERPVLLAVDGEARALVERANAGVAVPPGDAEALTAAIIRLAADPARREAMGRAGSRLVEAEFSRTVWANRYLDLLAAVASPARRRAACDTPGVTAS